MSMGWEDRTVNNDMAAFWEHATRSDLNPHPQYKTVTAAAADLAAHVAAADPHTGYRLESVTIGTTDIADGAVTRAKLESAYRPIYRGSAAPGTPSSGDIHFDTDDNLYYRYTGSAWVHMPFSRIGYTSRSSNYTINSATLGSMGDIFSSSITFTAAGSVSYWVEFYCARSDTGGVSGAINAIHLVDGSGNSLGIIAINGQSDGTVPATASLSVRIPYTPASGSRTVNARGVYQTAGNGTLYAGSGYIDMYLAVYGPSTT